MLIISIGKVSYSDPIDVSCICIVKDNIQTGNLDKLHDMLIDVIGSVVATVTLIKCQKVVIVGLYAY